MIATPRRFLAAVAATALATPLLLSAASPAAAVGHAPGKAIGKEKENGKDAARKAAKLSKELVRSSSAGSAYRHLERLQEIADEAGGNRAAGTLGHDASAAYVYSTLQKAGYQVSYQNFGITYIETLAEKLSVVTPNPRDVAVTAMSYTKSTPEGGVRAALAAVPVDETTGCEPSDYASGDYTGKIALIQRGGCSFADKQREAGAAGAVAAIVYNNTEGALNGTLGDPAAGVIPTGGITKEAGEALAAEAAAGTVTVSLDIRQLQEERTTRNVIAETKGGRSDRTVMLGAHLDSVTEGPGINDNGSGSAGLLEVALKLARTHEKPTNKVRFAWWSAEELGLLGAEHYVGELTGRQRADIALYLNFDMIASPNPAQFVYDGDNSDGGGEGPGPEGSAQIEKDITDYLDSRNVPHEGTDFDGRSDYGPFIEVGIASGGTFTGAEGIKTEEQARRYGGEAGVAYDPCYHSACDNLSNIDMPAFGVNIGVIAHAVGTYAHDLGSLKRPVPTPSVQPLKTADPSRKTAETAGQGHDRGHTPTS
ncbi:M28 family metallopeptidase [Streptomyces sp. NPDC093085]|uniref:M28 family metallopeptidase n=1 Tax=Streptomyces sp. NPDC093085 TaxID=3155068 RepID=UPI00341B6708